MRNRVTTAAILISLTACAQIKPDTVITAKDTTITRYSVVVKSITYDTLKSITVIPVVQSLYLRKNLRFEMTTENSDALTKFAQFALYNWNSLGECCGYSIERSTDYARAGNYSTRYELNKTDADVALSKRTEAARYSGDEPTLAERWYGGSYFLYNWVTDIAPELVTQWQSKLGSNPPLALWSNNGKWEAVLFGTTHKYLGATEKNKWTDFVFHVKWSTTSNGLIEVWKDGIKVLSYTGANSYEGYPGNYMKVGIYKWPWKKGQTSYTTKRVMYADEIRIGNEFSNYDDVKPGN